MPTVTVKFTNPDVADVKILQMRRRNNRKFLRVLQLHDTAFNGTDTWQATLTFQTPGPNRKVVLRVLALDRAKNVIASVTLPTRRFPK